MVPAFFWHANEAVENRQLPSKKQKGDQAIEEQ
jgi:hypothetical protein